MVNVHVDNQGFWQFGFHGVHFNHDSQNSFQDITIHGHQKWLIMASQNKLGLPLPITATSQQRPPSSVPKVALMERFDCNKNGICTILNWHVMTPIYGGCSLPFLIMLMAIMLSVHV